MFMPLRCSTATETLVVQTLMFPLNKVTTQERFTSCLMFGVWVVLSADLLEAGDGVHEFDIQFGVVLSQRLVSVVADELHHWAERQRVGEAVLPVPMVDLYQLVVAPFPEHKEKIKRISAHLHHVQPFDRSSLIFTLQQLLTRGSVLLQARYFHGSGQFAPV